MSSTGEAPDPAGTVRHFRTEGAVPEGTLTQLFIQTVDRFRERPAYLTLDQGDPTPFTYDEVLDIVRRGASGLVGLGLVRGDRAAILSENRIEWPLADFSCLAAGVVDVPIYGTLTVTQVRYILDDSKAALVFASNADQVAKVQEAAKELSHAVRIVVFDESAQSTDVMSWSQFLEAGAGDSMDEFRERALEARPHDTATLIYTSGTTGNPKGVMLTHNNLASNVWASSQVLPVDTDDSSLSFLPLSHVLQRMVDYLFFSGGCVIAHCSIESVSREMKRIRPTKVVSVPRLYEKVYQSVTTGEGLKGRLSRWAVTVGQEWLQFEQRGQVPPVGVRIRFWVADRLVFKKIRAGLGGRLKYFVSGGAPLAPDINRFFYAAGVKILEGYGLTETSPVINVSSLEDLRIGTVGRPIVGTEVRIADDGEILVRGPQVMKGYYGLVEKTAEVLDEEGWFSTGDIGELSVDGFLTITDRKKDLIKTSGGKYVAPQPIENRLKKIPFVDQAVVVGEGKNFCSVLIVPALDQLRTWAQGEGLRASDDALEDEQVQEALAARVFSELTDLARYETPKKIGLLLKPFTIEDGTLTPTQKVKRKVVLERHAALIESFYEAANVERTVFVAS